MLFIPLSCKCIVLFSERKSGLQQKAPVCIIQVDQSNTASLVSLGLLGAGQPLPNSAFKLLLEL